MKPVLQLALDFVDLDRALKVAEEAKDYVDWIEAGTPLIKSEGLNSVRELRKKFPNKVIVADMKVMDAGRIEVEAAAKAGADVVNVLGAASDSTIRECIEAGRNYGVKIIVDLIGVENIVERAKQIEKLGADYIGIHIAIDEQMLAKSPFEKIKKVSSAIKIPITAAGGINSESVVDAINSGASVLIVGGAITKAEDAKKAAREIKKTMETGKKVKTKLFKRTTDIREIFKKVSTANISDAMHRIGDLKDIYAITSEVKMIGPAVTVRTYPGDWAKSVEAIDIANKGDVIVIDAGGIGPAVWGELATNSSIQKKISGVVIDGATRDTEEIRKLDFPVFTKFITPCAGEPRGLGEINIPVKISDVTVKPGDWIVGDDDGVVVIPKEKAVEIANRAMDVLERENRIRKEIRKEKSTLSKVTHLLKWEKK